MNYVLIWMVILFGGGTNMVPSTGSAVFKDEAACKQAAAEIKSWHQGNRAACLPEATRKVSP